jgi:hypothetical protein
MRRPYLTQYTIGNPYDTSQATVSENGTTRYNVYEYSVVNSSVGLVMDAWVCPNMTIVTKIFTYHTCGPRIVSFGYSIIVSSSVETTTTSQTGCPTDVR